MLTLMMSTLGIEMFLQLYFGVTLQLVLIMGRYAVALWQSNSVVEQEVQVLVRNDANIKANSPATKVTHPCDTIPNPFFVCAAQS